MSTGIPSFGPTGKDGQRLGLGLGVDLVNPRASLLPLPHLPRRGGEADLVEELAEDLLGPHVGLEGHIQRCLDLRREGEGLSGKLSQELILAQPFVRIMDPLF
jgi:hypothetical protein